MKSRHRRDLVQPRLSSELSLAGLGDITQDLGPPPSKASLNTLVRISAPGVHISAPDLDLARSHASYSLASR
jgi:hypothetical protein